MPTVADIADFLGRLAPIRRAAQWDNVGLILGKRAAEVRRVLVCLTVTPEVVAEALATTSELIVTHHPMLFRPTQKITDATVEGRMVLDLLRAGVAVYSPHTAFDNCPGGINDLLAARLGLSDVRALRPYPAADRCKVAVFVPDTDLGKVADAMFAAGAGIIGQYSQCSFRLAGTGTFFGSDAAQPTVGQRGRREEVSEWRLEAVCPESAVESVIAAIRRAHSYEEPAFDVYPLRGGHDTGGEGRSGTLAAPLALAEFARNVRTVLACGPVQVIGPVDRTVRRVALACGAAGEFLSDAIEADADVFLTGEMRFHDYLAAQARGIALVLPGHFATERIAIAQLAGQLTDHFSGLQACASCRDTDPVSWI